MKISLPSRCLASVATALLASISALEASSLVTIAESPSDFTSSLKNTSLFDFNTLSLGLDKNVVWSGVGSFDQLYVINANQYGGAPSEKSPAGSAYSVQGIGSPVKSTTLTLNTPSSYFGFYWSAGDAANQLQFYKGNTLVAEFTTKSLLSNLPRDYYGNPINRKLNAGEPYAFINFYGDKSTTWDRVVLTNASSSGFESDNYTSRVMAWNGQTDGKLAGRPVVEVNGKTATVVTSVEKLSAKWAYEPSAPAAPAPPLVAVGAFALILGLRGLKQAKRIA